MNIKITPGMTAGGTKFTPQQWAEAGVQLATGQSREMQVARGMIVLSYAPVVKTASAPIRLGMAYRKNPALMILANHATRGSVRSAAGAMLTGSKAIRYAGYIQMTLNPLLTYKYAKKGDYKRAAMTYFGPPGTVWVYNRTTRQYEKESIVQPKVVKKPIRRGKMPSEMPADQKRRLRRMGLRWCRKHGRYDRCSLRERR